MFTFDKEGGREASIYFDYYRVGVYTTNSMRRFNHRKKFVEIRKLQVSKHVAAQKNEA